MPFDKKRLSNNRYNVWLFKISILWFSFILVQFQFILLRGVLSVRHPAPLAGGVWRIIDRYEPGKGRIKTMTKLDFLVNLLLHTLPIQNVSKGLPLELLHHYKYFCLTQNTDNLYIPLFEPDSKVIEKGNHVLDGLIWDPKKEKILETLQFKCKIGEKVSLSVNDFNKLQNKLVEKVDTLDIGFKHQEALFKNTQKLDAFISSHEKPQIIMSDFSSYWLEADEAFKDRAIELFSEAGSNKSIIKLVSEGAMLGDLLV